MGAEAAVGRIHEFLSKRNIPVAAPHNPDLILPGIAKVTESRLRQNNDYHEPYAPSLLVETRPYQRKLALAIEFIQGSSGLELDVRRQGTYRELRRWKRKTGTDWPEHLAEKVTVSAVLIGRHGMSVRGIGSESKTPFRVNIDLDNGRVSQNPVTPAARHSLVA